MFKLEIETVNAAFDDEPASEIARILRELAGKMEREGAPARGYSWTLWDVNGNRVGRAYVSKASA
jgi:hypothetical protein